MYSITRVKNNSALNIKYVTRDINSEHKQGTSTLTMKVLGDYKQRIWKERQVKAWSDQIKESNVRFSRERIPGEHQHFDKGRKGTTQRWTRYWFWGEPGWLRWSSVCLRLRLWSRALRSSPASGSLHSGKSAKYIVSVFKEPIIWWKRGMGCKLLFYKAEIYTMLFGKHWQNPDASWKNWKTLAFVQMAAFKLTCERSVKT